MRRVINGVTYDTDDATEIAQGNHHDERSQASWRLYQTAGGVYFEVATDSDGIPEEFRPLTDQQARHWLEVHANGLVERCFGAMPEASRPLFSRRTLIAGIDVLEFKYDGTEIGAFFTDLGPDIYEHLPDGGSRKSRMTELKRFIDRNPHRIVDGSTLENVVVDRAIALLPPLEPEYPWSQPATTLPVFERLRRALSQDGFVVADGQLRRELPADVGLPVAEAELIRLLDKHNLKTTKVHLDSAFRNHAAGDWTAANSQVRTFFESLFEELAVKLDPATSQLKSSHERRRFLANIEPPIFDRSLNEWDDNGAGFVNGLFKRLHTNGSHPGMSDEEDCTFRLHVVLLTTRLFLTRYDKRP